MTDTPSPWGKWLMLGGVALLAIGAVVWLLDRFGIHLGRLPGDIHVEGERGSFYFPWVTSLIISVIATLLLNWFSRR